MGVTSINTGGSVADGSFIQKLRLEKNGTQSSLFSEMFPMIDVLKRHLELLEHTKKSKGSVTVFGQGSQGG